MSLRTILNKIKRHDAVPPDSSHIQQLLLKQNEQLYQLNLDKDHFIGIASHDLQHPLTTILMLSEALLKKEAEELSEKGKQICQMIHEASLQMKELISNYLDSHRYQSGKVKIVFTENNITALTNKIVGRYREIAGRKNIFLEFSAEKNFKMMTDMACYTQIVENLVSNAIKFSHNGKSVLVSLKEKDKQVLLEVKDEGVGIKKKEIPLLFERFQQLTSRPTADEISTGLGLSIVKYLADQLKAEIEVNSVYKKGSVFRVKFSK